MLPGEDGKNGKNGNHGNHGNNEKRDAEKYGRRRYDINGRAFDWRVEWDDGHHDGMRPHLVDGTTRNGDESIAPRSTSFDGVSDVSPADTRAVNFAGKGPKGWRRPDARIREELSEVLARHPAIDATDIELDVQYGAITISGTVANRRIKRLVEVLAEDIFGVTDVQNRLHIRHDISLSREIFRQPPVASAGTVADRETDVETDVETDAETEARIEDGPDDGIVATD